MVFSSVVGGSLVVASTIRNIFKKSKFESWIDCKDSIVFVTVHF